MDGQGTKKHRRWKEIFEREGKERREDGKRYLKEKEKREEKMERDI